MKIGYLVPEFPGQTHAFFWREIAALGALGIEAQTVSTRRPAAEIVCHEWARQAMDETAYLMPPSAREVAGGLGAGLWAGPAGWARCIGAVFGADAASVMDRARFSALIVMGAQLAGLARRRGWTHIHVHSCADAAMIAMFASMLGGAPYSLTLHGRLSDYGPGQSVKWRNAAFGTTVTRTLKAELLAAVPELDEASIAVGAMGVDTASFTRRTAYAGARPGGPVRIVSCGRLHPGKGHATLIEATALLRAQGMDAALTVLGEGPARRDLEALSEARGIAANVKLPGATSEGAVREALEASHMFALASRDEAIGVATMEAMSMGLPVVVTGVGGVSELVRDGVDGVLVRPEDPVAVAREVGAMVADPVRAAAMGAAGAARIRERFHSGVSAAVLADRLVGHGAHATNVAAIGLK